MINNVYILHTNTSTSREYLNQCLQSLKPHTNLTAIPVEGYDSVDYKEICKLLDVHTIPFYEEMATKDKSTVDKAFSCTAGHYKIWKMIVESGVPGVVLEHDAIAKGNFSSLSVPDDYIIWLGPRVEHEDDYTLKNSNVSVMAIDRFEGTHAYAITPVMAQNLIDNVHKHGLCDSIDGMLGMRNIFDLKFATLDPPLVVAPAAGRISTIDSQGRPPVWNSHALPGFMAGLKPGIAPPPVRRLIFSNIDFHTKYSKVRDRLTAQYANKQNRVLVIGAYEGLSTFLLTNDFLSHEDSDLVCMIPDWRTIEQKEGAYKVDQLRDVYAQNVYLSKFYYKIENVVLDEQDPVLVASVLDPEVRFNLIVVDGDHTQQAALSDISVAIDLLADGGTIIVDDTDRVPVKAALEYIQRTRGAGVKIEHQEGIALITKC